MKQTISSRLLIPVALGLATLSACSADAYDDMGTINATIDGTPYTAITLSETSNNTASATFLPIGGVTMISIQGHDMDTGGVMDNVLNLEVGVMGTAADGSVLNATVTYWPEGMSGPFYTSEQANRSAIINFDELSLDDNAVANGNFEAILCRQENFFSEVDPENCIDITGSFATGLQREEDL